MSEASPYKIFISYRRDDSQDSVGHIYDRLKARFGADAIFIDVTSIPVGYVFASYIHHVLEQCRVALIVIGPTWPTIVETRENPYKGQPRLNNPDDYVRIETEQALSLAEVNAAGEPTGRLRLIPVLVQGAHMPEAEQLPERLQRLTKFNSASVKRYPEFDHDIEQLSGVIATWMGIPSPAARTAPEPAPKLPPADPISELLARFLPQLRDARDGQDWPQVARLVALLRRHMPAERIPTEAYAIQGHALLAEHDYAGAKTAWDTVRQRDPLDATALWAAADARIGLGERAEALPLLDDALTLTSDRDQRQVLLLLYASVLDQMASQESEASAQSYWNHLLRCASEGLRLAGEQNPVWLAFKLSALTGLGRTQEALDIARYLTARPETNAAQWLARARLAWKLAGETPTDEVRTSLASASRLFPNDSAVAQAQHDLLVILPPNSFPPRLADLDFTAQKRAGVAFVVPPICPVPAGAFLMGSDPRRDKGAQPDEQPQRSIPVGAFSIARFPVTVAEYACFVEAEHSYQPSNWASQLQKLDHPVVNISWNDAVAYAAWLATTTGQPWRLPTEAEWEKAARWDARAGVARLYPWGDSFDQTRCNTREGGKGGTTAVGSYPTGASPCGAEEMAGNVWERTHSLYKPYPYTGNDGREVEKSTDNRVLRGGSWDFYAGDARASVRFSVRPDDRLNGFGVFGFRLAVPGSA